MKCTRIVVEVKKGLPNYSSETVTTEIVADEDENLKLEETIKSAKQKIYNSLSKGE